MVLNNIICLYKTIKMKKALEVKSIMFALDQNHREKQIHSPSPRKGLTRIQTSLSQHKFKGSKLQKRRSEDKQFRKFSHQSPPKKKTSNCNQERQRNEYEAKKSRCLSQNPSRYYQPFADSPEESMIYCRSNMKMGPWLQTEVSPHKEDKRVVTSMNWDEMLELRKGRMKSEPTNNINLKNEIMVRVSKKLDFMKKMTEEGQPTPSHFQKTKLSIQCQGSKLFNFDRLYEHCLKKINKNLNIYEKDLGKSKDRKYYQLKIESSILSTELKSMRKSLQKQKQRGRGELGVIGNVIELGRGERVVSQRGERPCSGCARVTANGFRKKLGLITRKMQCSNPFKGELHGWQIRHDEFELK